MNLKYAGKKPPNFFVADLSIFHFFSESQGGLDQKNPILEMSVSVNKFICL
jgi:hypothetical protein